MVVAPFNIYIFRYAMSSFLDDPLEMNETTGTTKDSNLGVQAADTHLKKYNIDNIPAIIIDEISVDKP